MLVIWNRWIWRSELEMHGWDFGGRPDPLPENEDDEQDIEPGNVGDACGRELFRYRLGSVCKQGTKIAVHFSIAPKEKKKKHICAFRKSWPTKARPGRKVGRKAQLGNLEFWKNERRQSKPTRTVD